MENINDLYEWADYITIMHMIKILQDSGLTKEDIMRELALTKQDYEKNIGSIVD